MRLPIRRSVQRFVRLAFQAFDPLFNVRLLSTSCVNPNVKLPSSPRQDAVFQSEIGTFQQVADNLGAVNVRLDTADFERIDALAPPRGVVVHYYDRAIAREFRPHSQRSVV